MCAELFKANYNCLLTHFLKILSFISNIDLIDSYDSQMCHRKHWESYAVLRTMKGFIFFQLGLKASYDSQTFHKKLWGSHVALRIVKDFILFPLIRSKNTQWRWWWLDSDFFSQIPYRIWNVINFYKCPV